MTRTRALLPAVLAAVVLVGLYLLLDPGTGGDAASGDTGGQDREYHLTLRDQRLASGPSVLAATQGDTVTIVVSSDRDVTIYVHGYDRSVDVPAEEQATLPLPVEHAGRFPVDLHAPGVHVPVAVLEVQPR